jgi:hypothetical protein
VLRRLAPEQVFYYDGGMTSIPASAGGAAGDPAGLAAGDAGGGEAGGFDEVGTGGRVAALLAAVDGLADSELWRCSQADLARLVQVTEVAARRLVMVQGAAAVQAHERGVTVGAGFTTAGASPQAAQRSIAGWLRSLVTIGQGQARARANAAVALLADPARTPDLDPARAAARDGRISAAHVGVIADAVEQLSQPATPTAVADADTRADAARFLTEHARVLDPAQTRVLATRTLAVLDPDAGDRLAHDEDARQQRRGLSFAPDRTGLVHLSGVLTAECAGALSTAIDAASAPRPAADGSPDPRTPAMRRHDGLQHILQQVIAADGVLPTSHGSPYRLVVTVPHATLTAALTRTHRPGRDWNPTSTGSTAASTAASTSASTDTGRGEAFGPAAEPGPVQPGLLPDGWPVSPLTVQTLACTADLVPVLVDENHQPLDVGDTQYPFPTKIRTAIITRVCGDTATAGSSTAPDTLSLHLALPRWVRPTSIDNGALLCGRHHRYVHALHLTGHTTTTGGRSHVHWDHRPTSWTATTATAWATPTRPDRGHDPHEPPILTDRCLDELIRRWQRRQHAHRHAA